MGLAATFIARLLHKHRWIAYIGLLIILYVSIDMMIAWRTARSADCNPAWFGSTEIEPALSMAPATTQQPQQRTEG